MYRGLTVDFYGTLVEEDDAVVGRIAERVAAASPRAPSPGEVGADWSRRFSALCAAARGEHFRAQRALEVESLRGLLRAYGAPLDPEELSGELFAYWVAPDPLPGAAEFLERCPVPVCNAAALDRAAPALRRSRRRRAAAPAQSGSRGGWVMGRRRRSR